MSTTEPVHEQIAHCVSKIGQLTAHPPGEPRTLFQLGYNLGRLSELTGLGREPFWDRWKQPVLDWDQERLSELALELQPLALTTHTTSLSTESTTSETAGS
jgi:hypothetical protein